MMTTRKMFRLCVGFGLAMILALGLVYAPTAAAEEPDPVLVSCNTGKCDVVGVNSDDQPVTYAQAGTVKNFVENNNQIIVICMTTSEESGIDLNQSIDPTRGFSFKNILCAICLPDGSVVLTDDTHFTISASGVATGTCIYTKP